MITNSSLNSHVIWDTLYLNFSCPDNGNAWYWILFCLCNSYWSSAEVVSTFNEGIQREPLNWGIGRRLFVRSTLCSVHRLISLNSWFQGTSVNINFKWKSNTHKIARLSFYSTVFIKSNVLCQPYCTSPL